ncbi:MAG: hypothetical protein LC107_09840 [Chitinophagales bacterium]|nr:hypothetical protein [Chitinophagales bacterium]
MRYLNAILFLIMTSIAMQAQLINNGGTITVQDGATLRVESNLTNQAGSTIINNGIIQVSKDLTNAGTFTSGATSKVAFIGDDNSDVTSGGATFRYVEIQKDDENVTLLDEMKISTTLDFLNDNNRVNIADHNLVILVGGDINNASSSRYVVTDGTGFLVKEIDADEVLNFEIGSATDYTPVSCNISGSDYTSATTRARVYETGLTLKYGDASDFISREWQVTASGITGYENTMTGTYEDGDITGTEADIKGAYYTTDWKFDNSSANPTDNEVSATTTVADVRLSGMNFFGKANLKAFLSGAMTAGSSMTKLLNTNGLIPLTTPYTVAPFNAPTVTTPAIPTEATDWILVEVRDAANPTSIISQTSGFILTDGSIVSYDGSALRLKNAVANGIIALRHRNHLPIRTASGLNLVNPTLKNFSTGTTEAYNNPSVTSNANMNLINGIYAMWAGDVNQDGYVRFIPQPFPPVAGDCELILSEALSGDPEASLNNVYTPYDVNMDRYVKYIFQGFPPIAADNDIILSESLAGIPNRFVQLHF